MPTITSTIVTVNAEVTAAPVSSTLQQSGALVSVGGTTVTTGTAQFCPTLADVVALLSSSGNYQEIQKMATTFFAQGNAVGVWILELGTQISASAGIAALGTWITANPGIFYAYLVPATWDTSAAALNTLASNYASPTGKTYFFPTTSTGTMSAYAGTKSVIFTVPSPSAASTEFQAAALFYNWLSNAPTATNPVPPLSYRFVFGVTPWSRTNNQTAITNILSAYGNIILTGAEGGISNSCIFKGTTADGQQAMSWWAIDWFQINSKQRLAAAVINGSNENPPLYYNQNGINRLLAVLTSLLKTGISFGLLLSGNIQDESFIQYTQENPNDYAAGNYAGFSATITAQNGFLTITFNVDAVQFVPAA